MANRRMLSVTVSVSDKTNSISDFAALLFSWMIPHADDYGILYGTPGRIKALVVPRRSQTELDVDKALDEMCAAGLIYRYVNNGQQYVQLVNFDEHQHGLQKRTGPRHPFFDSEGSEPFSGKFREIPGNSCLTEPNLTEPNLREENYNELNLTELNFTDATVGNFGLNEEELVVVRRRRFRRLKFGLGEAGTAKRGMRYRGLLELPLASGLSGLPSP